jgi:nucleolin
VVEAHHVNDKFDPTRKRGFGFVTMDSLDACSAAIGALADMDLQGRSLKVDFALAKGEPRPERPPREARPDRAPFRARVDDTGRRVYVGNLDFNTSSDTLAKIFSEFGSLERCEHLEERDMPGRRRGFGFITFENAAGAEAAVEQLDGLEVDGRSIRVNIAQPKAY